MGSGMLLSEEEVDSQGNVNFTGLQERFKAFRISLREAKERGLQASPPTNKSLRKGSQTLISTAFLGLLPCSIPQNQN